MSEYTNEKGTTFGMEYLHVSGDVAVYRRTITKPRPGLVGPKVSSQEAFARFPEIQNYTEKAVPTWRDRAPAFASPELRAYLELHGLDYSPAMNLLWQKCNEHPYTDFLKGERTAADLIWIMPDFRVLDSAGNNILQVTGSQKLVGSVQANTVIVVNSDILGDFHM